MVLYTARPLKTWVLARPDPKTFQILSGRHDDELVARVFCDITNLDGTPFAGCPRNVLKRSLDKVILG